MRRLLIGLALAGVTAALAPAAASAQTFSVLGQPDLASTTQATRCADPSARFNFTNAGGFDQHGPSGVAVDSTGRLFVTDFAGDRVLSWPNAAALTACQPADRLIQGGGMDGPEAVAVDDTGTVYVASTLNHTVRIYSPPAVGNAYTLAYTFGTAGVAGNGAGQFNFPRGLAISGNRNTGQLFVADDFNNRVLVFSAPFANAQNSSDSIGAGLDGGFSHPKGLAFAAGNLYVTDYDKNRVLRFNGPFDNPATTYDASAIFSGLANPIDVAVGDDNLHVTDQANQRVVSYFGVAASGDRAAPDTSFSDNIGPEPLGVAVGAGRLFLADYTQYRVLIREPVPSPSTTPPPGEPPSGTDTTAPIVTITKAPDRKIEKRKAKFKFTADEANVAFECKFDRDQFEGCSSPTRYKRIDDGKHKFKVRATDAAGNLGGPAKAKFKVDTD